jgi:glucose/arabinose dehydrogenase
VQNRRRLIVLLALFGVVLVAVAPMGTSAAIALPSGFTASTYVSGFADRVTAMDWAPDGRLFVSEKTGNLRVVKSGKLLSQPFLHVAVNSDSERGLLGVTFDPNYASNRFVYVFYTSTAAKNRVSRFTASATNPDVVQAGSEKILLDNIPPDGKLYISVGDSSSGPNSQSLSSLAGKLLRINSDGTIPTDNPFVGQANRRAEVWAYGLRNPYTFAFKQGSSTMFINDVGFNTWEEINRGIRGANYGWPICEGVCSTAGMTNPIYAYNHADGPGKAITGGVFYNGGKFPSSYAGDYFFADYVGGYIKSYDTTTGAVTGFATGVPSPVDLRVGPDGALYYLSVNGMLVGRIIYGSAVPTPTPTPSKPPVGKPPQPTITLPASGTTYRAGDVISYSGAATDAEDGTLGAAALTWEVVFHHDTHTHPYIEPFSGVTHGTFTIEDRGETSANTWYRIHCERPTRTETRPRSRAMFTP